MVDNDNERDYNDRCWVCENLAPGEDLMSHAVEDDCDQAWRRLISVGLATENDRKCE